MINFVLLAAVIPAVAQQGLTNGFNVGQFAGGTVGAKLTAAQNSCLLDTNVPCILVLDPALAVVPVGTLPTRCANCTWLDYRFGFSFSGPGIVLSAGPGATPTVDSQLSSCGSTPCFINILPGYTGVFPPVGNAGLNNVVIEDYHLAGTSTLPFGTNTITYGGETPGVYSPIRRSFALTNPDRSVELDTDVITFTGTLPNNQTLEGLTSTALTTGTISGGGTGLAIAGIESHAQTQSNGGTITNLYSGIFGSQAVSGTTNVTNAVGGLFQPCTNSGSGTLANCYGAIFQPQAGGGTRNFDFWSQGQSLYSNGAGYNWNIVDHLSATQNWWALDSSDNLILRDVGGTIEMRHKGSSAAVWRFTSPSFAIDPDAAGFQLVIGTTAGFKFSGGSALTGVTGSGSSLVTNTSPTITTPTLSGVTNGTGLQMFNTTTTCTTAASAGATCTTAAISLPVAESDTSYRVACTGKGITNVPVVIATTNSSASQFTITIAALTAAAASFSSFDCHVGHS